MLCCAISIQVFVVQMCAAAREEGYRAGVQETPPTGHTPSSAVGEEEVGKRVKSIMNMTYQTMTERLKSKEEFQRSEVLSLLLATIKVGVAYVWVWDWELGTRYPRVYCVW